MMSESEENEREKESLIVFLIKQIIKSSMQKSFSPDCGALLQRN